MENRHQVCQKHTLQIKRRLTKAVKGELLRKTRPIKVLNKLPSLCIIPNNFFAQFV